MEKIREYKHIIATCLLFAILYSLISLVNHYNFRTYALDLGAYTNALFDYIHFQWNDSSVFKEVKNNLLADHFDLYLIIFSPLSIIFGTYTLLIVQIIAVILGGLGVYAFFNIQKENKPIALFALIYFYAFFGVFNTIAFDYHSNVVAAALIPWLFYFFAKRNFLISSILIILTIVAKENISLWLVFILTGLAVEYRKDIFLRNYLIFAAIFSLGSFIIITSIIMPAISINGTYPHFHYSFLGDNMTHAVIHLVSHPIESIKVLFTNHNNSPHGDFVKVETHIILFISGLIMLLKKPHYLLMLVPIYFQKLFHDDYLIWGIGGQYNIEFAPILTIGIFSIISEIKGIKFRKIMSYFVLLLVIGATIRTMDNTVLFTDKSRIRFYQKEHYQRDYDVKKVHKYLSKIPKNAKVSAQSPFVPHLSLREDIYQFPIIKNADYIVYSRMEGYYPLSKEEFELKVNELENSSDWKIIYNDDFTILKKSVSNKQ